MRDLELRGAGNLLGDEQSGHVAAIGFELYCELLAEAVAELQGAARPAAAAAGARRRPGRRLRPGRLRRLEAVKIDVHRRIALAGSVTSCASCESELADRFGPLPEPVDEPARDPGGAHRARAAGRGRPRVRASGRVSGLRSAPPRSARSGGQSRACSTRPRTRGLRCAFRRGRTQWRRPRICRWLYSRHASGESSSCADGPSAVGRRPCGPAPPRLPFRSRDCVVVLSSFSPRWPRLLSAACGGPAAVIRHAVPMSPAGSRRARRGEPT